MKKLFIAFCFVALPVNFCNASVMGNGGATEVTQWLNQGLLTVNKTITTVTQYATVAMKIKQLVSDPKTALFGSNAGKQIEAETRKWLAGGLANDPLLVRNPEAYIKNTQTNALRQQIAILEASNNRSAATDGIILSLIKQRRAELSNSPAEPADRAPQIIQDSLCKDNGAKLLQMASDEVSTDPEELQSDTTQNTINARFSELYADLCTGSVKGNPDLQKKLIAASQSPGFFDWSLWLATTGGNTDYNRRVQTMLEIDKRTQEKAALAQQEITTGGGYLSDKKCVEYMKNDDEGNAYPDGTGGCIAWEVIKPADTVKDIAAQLDINNLLKPLYTATKEQFLANDALSGITDVFKGIQQTVGTITSVANQAVQLNNSINTLIGTVGAAANMLGNGGTANTNSINWIGTTGTNYTGVGQRTYVAPNVSSVTGSNQTSDGLTPAERSTVTGPMKATLLDHKTAMQALPQLISALRGPVTAYSSSLTDFKSCVDSIPNLPNFDAAADQSRVNGFVDEYNTRRDQYNPLIQNLNLAISKLAGTNTTLDNALTTITNSQNIAVIGQTFDAYQDALNRGIILPSNFDITLDGYVRTTIPQANTDRTGALQTLIGNCNSMVQEINARTP